MREQPEVVPIRPGQLLVHAGKDRTLAAARGARQDTAARVGAVRVRRVRRKPPDDVRPSPEPARPLGDELFERRWQRPGLRRGDLLLRFGDHLGQEIADHVRDERPEARHRLCDRIPLGGVVAAPRAQHRVVAQLPLRRRKCCRPFRRPRPVGGRYQRRGRRALVAVDDRLGLVHPRVVERPEVDPAACLLIEIAPQPELDLQRRDALALE